MNNNVQLNNEVHMIGTVESEPVFSHKLYDEGFFSFVLAVPRLSDISDYINVTVSERIISYQPLTRGLEVEVDGQFRSYNNFSGVGSKLLLTVFARDINPVVEATDLSDPNTIFLNGYLCRKPIYRTTPFGREIADILLAVNRSYGKSDYIPCIAWGRNAKFASTMEVGQNIKIWGRIQSREYQKKLNEDETQVKTAFEVSIAKMEVPTE